MSVKNVGFDEKFDPINRAKDLGAAAANFWVKDKGLNIKDITSLDDNCNRIRKSDHAEVLASKAATIWLRIVTFFQDLFSGNAYKANDNKDFDRYYTALDGKIKDLTKLAGNKSDGSQTLFFEGMKDLWHVEAKIQYLGWAESLKDNENYKKFKTDLGNLQKTATANVKDWIAKGNDSYPTVQRQAIGRWIEAGSEEDGKRIQFAGYSNEIAFKAEEVPCGAVMLYNPDALKVRDKINGHGTSAKHIIKKIKTFFCNLFTGMPVTHAMASLGGGKYFHVDKVSESSGKQTGSGCSGIPQEEDFTTAGPNRKGKVKYMFEYEIMVPNYAEFGKTLLAEGHIKENSPAAVDAYLKKDWTATIKSTEGTKESPATQSSFWDIISTVFGSTRPEGYVIEDVFNPRPESGYSCSGLVSASLAKHGIDIVEKQGKRVNKAAPADFAKTPYYDVAYSSNREGVEALKNT